MFENRRHLLAGCSATSFESIDLAGSPLRQPGQGATADGAPFAVQNITESQSIPQGSNHLYHHILVSVLGPDMQEYSPSNGIAKSGKSGPTERLHSSQILKAGVGPLWLRVALLPWPQTSAPVCPFHHCKSSSWGTAVPQRAWTKLLCQGKQGQGWQMYSGKLKKAT